MKNKIIATTLFLLLLFLGCAKWWMMDSHFNQNQIIEYKGVDMRIIDYNEREHKYICKPIAGDTNFTYHLTYKEIQ